jgi:hypothetical protein
LTSKQLAIIAAARRAGGRVVLIDPEEGRVTRFTAYTNTMGKLTAKWNAATAALLAAEQAADRGLVSLGAGSHSASPTGFRASLPAAKSRVVDQKLSRISRIIGLEHGL